MLLAQDAHPHLTDKEVAKMLGFSPAGLRKMRQHGHGPAFFKLGRSIRYDPADVAAYLGRRRVRPSNEGWA